MKTKFNFLSKLVILFLMFTTTVFSQSITNTLGTNGLFTIKDATTNYLTLNQSTGQVNILKSLRLENTTNTGLGIIFKGADRFLHNFGTNNLFLGINSGNFTMTIANVNTGIGQSSLLNLTTGDANTAVGFEALHKNTSGSKNTALGSGTLYDNTAGSQNTALGFMSLTNNTTGCYNSALGHISLYSNTTGLNNTALGNQSLFSNTTGNDNTALGLDALYTNSSGSSNIALGNKSLYFNTTGSQNTALGIYSLSYNTVGNSNTALGYQSLNFNTTGFANTALGLSSLSSNTIGTQNTGVGYSTGSNVTTGDNLTLVGYDAEPTSGITNNQITLGNNAITSLRCNVQTITSLSDARDKKNITDLSLGLDFLMKVKPRLFNWDKREWYDNNISDGTKIQQIPTAGFIAQELDEVQTTENAEWLNLVLKDNPEKIEASYGNLLPVMVKAIQELKSENDNLKQNNENLLSEVHSLKLMDGKIAKLEQTISEMASVKQTSFKISEVSKTIFEEGEAK